MEWQPLGPEEGQETSRLALVAGRFDVPFALDWRYLGAFSRRFITAPLAVETLGTNWGSQGLDLYGRLWDGRLYYCGWVVQGRALRTNRTAAEEFAVTRDGGFAFGGRVSLRTRVLPEIGLNGAFEFPQRGGLQQYTLDADLRWSRRLFTDGDRLSLRAEFLYQSWRESPAAADGFSPSAAFTRRDRFGGYAQLGYEYDDLFGQLRFSFAGEQLAPGGYEHQSSAVLGYAVLAEHLELRVEYSYYSVQQTGGTLLVQLVGQI